MKVLHIINSLEQGGKERRLVELVKGFTKIGDVQFSILTFKEDIAYKEILGCKAEILIILKPLNKVKLILELIKLIKKEKPDIIHTWDSLSSFYMYICSFVIQIKYIAGHLTTAPYSVRRTYGNLLYLLSFLSMKRAACVLSNSYAGLLSFNAPLKKSYVIYNGYDFNRLRLLNSNNVRDTLNIRDSFVVAMVASFNITKDYTSFLETAVNLHEKHRDIMFLCIGKGPLLDNYRNKYKKYQNITFLGGVSKVDDIINLCDLGVLMTNPLNHGEGISNAVMEFMAQGKPVIATRGGGTGEIINNNINGFLIEPFDVAGLGDKILYFRALGPFEQANIRANALSKIEKDFKIEKMVSNFYKLYTDLV